MMQFVGITAGIDAVLAILTLMLLLTRKSHLEQEGPTIKKTVGYFANYLAFTFAFLVLISVSMLSLAGTVQAVVVMFADFSLWISLIFFIMLVFVERPEGLKHQVVGIFLVLAGLGSVYQILGLLGIALNLGGVATYILQNMAPLLMYIVWIPSAVLFFVTAARTGNPIVKTRSLMLAVGLVLVTYSWASRLLQAEPSLLIVSTSSIIGFILLFGGVAYQQKPKISSAPSPV